MNDGHRTSTIARPKPRDRAEPTSRSSKTNTKTKSKTANTTDTRRNKSKPERAGRKQRTAVQRDERSSRLHDFTTPIERDKQLVPHRRGRLVVALFSMVIALAIGAALFVLPIKSWLQQRDDLATRTGELDTLNEANDRLQLEVDRLQTDAGVTEAAREEIDYVEAGEKRITVLPLNAGPAVLPPGWPYDLISRIVSLRQAEAAAATAAALAAATATTATTAATTVATTVATAATAPTTAGP